MIMKKVLSKDKLMLIATGVAIAVAAFVLTLLGNPKNMGFCIACFIRDIAGGFNLHQSENVQYIRPEILGLVLGSFIVSLIRGEFKARLGSNPVIRFVIGIIIMIESLVFLGCPLRMIIRLAAGDLNAVLGLFGFVLGVGGGSLFLNRGFSLGRSEKRHISLGLVAPSVQVVLLILVLALPGIFAFSVSGPGSMRAPFFASFAIALVIGGLCCISRFCCAGGIRDIFLMRDFTLFIGFASLFVTLLILNLSTGGFVLGFENQPIAHTEFVWNFLSMAGVGFGSVLLGGCPLRQLILSGEGNGDSFVTVLGMLTGAAISHNFNLASSPQGVTTGGKISVMFGLFLLSLIGFVVIKHNKRRG